MIVRECEPRDGRAIRAVHEAAFERAAEADLVEALEHEGVVLLSLAAEVEGRIVGHVLFSRMWIDTEQACIPAAALAPIAVLPIRQCQGIGSQLIRYALPVLRAQGERIAIVLGHPEYYPRFGFSSELARPLRSPFPPHAFMALELEAGALGGIRGKVRYPRAFGL